MRWSIKRTHKKVRWSVKHTHQKAKWSVKRTRKVVILYLILEIAMLALYSTYYIFFSFSLLVHECKLAS